MQLKDPKNGKEKPNRNRKNSATSFVSAQNHYPKYQVQNTTNQKLIGRFFYPSANIKRPGRRFLYYFSVYVNFFKERIISSDGTASELRPAYL
ncbi:hypothetical protein, partial [Prevotella falsenii]